MLLFGRVFLLSYALVVKNQLSYVSSSPTLVSSSFWSWASVTDVVFSCVDGKVGRSRGSCWLFESAVYYYFCCTLDLAAEVVVHHANLAEKSCTHFCTWQHRTEWRANLGGKQVHFVQQANWRWQSTLGQHLARLILQDEAELMH